VDTATSIRSYIRDELLVADGDALQNDTPLWGGVLDSVGLMQLISFIEERFGVEIEDEELTSAHFGTVADIAALVDRKVPGE
jgi:acyl carrier protein